MKPAWDEADARPDARCLPNGLSKAAHTTPSGSEGRSQLDAVQADKVRLHA